MYKLQYISQGVTAQEQFNNIQSALEAGCKWVQLRWKQGEQSALLQLALSVRELCDHHNATFIINDHADLVRQTGADGVHLGLTDMGIAEARTIVDEGKMVGGTANTLEDVLQRAHEGADYVGLGPFRYTTTKERLSPILGIEGYRNIMEAFAIRGINIPVYAIGGITLTDVEDLTDTGVYGVAVSGLVTNSFAKDILVKQMERILYRKEAV